MQKDAQKQLTKVYLCQNELVMNKVSLEGKETTHLSLLLVTFKDGQEWSVITYCLSLVLHQLLKGIFTVL